MNLLNETLRLLRATDTTNKSLAEQLNVSERWVGRLARGDYADPGVNKIQRLYGILSNEVVMSQTEKPEPF